MTRRFLLLIIACAMLATLAPPAARAQAHTVVLTGNRFYPAVIDDAQPGDEISLFWDGGAHNIEAFQGSTYRSEYQQTPHQDSFTFEGGIVRLRCLIHSRLQDGFDCRDMCATISDRPIDLEPPHGAITAPANGSVVTPTPSAGANGVFNPVTILGTATDDVGVFGAVVRLYDTTGVGAEYPATCSGCYTPSATWSLTRSLLPGSYVAEVLLADTSGNFFKSPRVSFIVL